MNFKNNKPFFSLSLLSVFLVLVFLVSFSPPEVFAVNTVPLTGTIRDFCKPAISDQCSAHPDFEATIGGVKTGQVESDLGLDKKPVFKAPAKTGFSNAANFNQWYNDVDGVNTKKQHSINLVNTSTNPSLYKFLSNSFFPIDGQLFKNQGRNHNFHYTYEIHTSFAYQTGQTLLIKGDDDVWVFINGKKVIDLGGIHPSATSPTVNLNTLGLTAGNLYDFDLFFAERHTASSVLQIDTTIKFDNTPPVITPSVGGTIGDNDWHTSDVPVSWTVVDLESKIRSTSGCDATTITTDTTGTTLTCTATSDGGTATQSVTIKRDATPPVITLIGANPLYLRDDGVAFTDPGANIQDTTSGPGPIVATNNVATSTPEVYSRVYNGKDNAGNNALEVSGIVDVVHINLDTPINAYSIGDNAYVTVIDYLAWRDNSIDFVSADIRSLFPDVASTTRELITPLRIDRTQGEGVFTNQNPVTLVLNDDCLSELPDPTCQEPLLTVVVNDDVKATYNTFDTAKARVAENVGGFLGAPPRTTDIVRFAESDRYQLGGSATVKVNDAVANTNPATAQSVTVQIKSSQDATGFTLTLNEDSINSGTFTGNTAVSFTTGSTSAPAIKANIGDIVTATYPPNGANVAQLTIVANDNVAFTAGNAIDNTRRDACSTDQDGDGICDAWETSTGLRIPTTVSGIDFFLPCTSGVTIVQDPTGITVCPSTTQKDVYLEIDYMLGHVPNNDALNDVTTALKAAPIRGLPGGAINGIVLHRYLGDSTPHQTSMAYTAGTGTTSFLNVKQQFFGTPAERIDANSNALLTAKRQVFHWAYVGHGQLGDPNSSGLGEKPGNDFWITLGAFSGKQGTRGQQAGTILHELGHNFGLGHGGGDETNCKGNYISVMNYLFQFDVPDGGFVAGRPLAYSYYKSSDITENALKENINSITAQTKLTIIGGATGSGGSIVPFGPTLTNTNVKIDWNRNGLDSSSATYAQDTNYFAAVSDCQVLDGSNAPLKSTLVGYNDGANAVYNFRGQSTFDSGAVVINQVHTTTSTDGTVTNEEFQTEISDIPDQSGDEGIAAFSGSGVYTDPDADTIVGTIDWGDGTSDSLTIVPVTDIGANFSFGPHTYADDNPTVTSSDPYTITVKITATRTDAGLNVYSYDSTNTATFTVNNVNPSIGAVTFSPTTLLQNSPVSVSAEFADPGTLDTHGISTINWGDGEESPVVVEPSSPNPGTVSASHTYTTSGSKTVTITVRDDDGGSNTKTEIITVNPVVTYTVQFTGVKQGDVIKKSKGSSHLDIEWIVKDSAGNVVPGASGNDDCDDLKIVGPYKITITPPSGHDFDGTTTHKTNNINDGNSPFLKENCKTWDYHQIKSVIPLGVNKINVLLPDGTEIGELTITLVP